MSRPFLTAVVNSAYCHCDRFNGQLQAVEEKSLSEGWLRIGWPVACEGGTALIILIDMKRPIRNADSFIPIAWVLTYVRDQKKAER